jgi:hypothetical protein
MIILFRESLPEQPQVRHCLEPECKECRASGQISSCSYELNLFGNHGKSPMAVQPGSPCHYNLPLTQKQESDKSPLCADYYP